MSYGTYLQCPQDYSTEQVLLSGISIQMDPEEAHAHSSEGNVQVKERLVERMANRRR